MYSEEEKLDILGNYDISHYKKHNINFVIQNHTKIYLIL